MTTKICTATFLAAVLAGCSGITFSDSNNGKSHPYRVASPALKVATEPNCKMTAEVISIPGQLNYLSFRSGLGKSTATVIFEPGGTIKQISSEQSGVADDLVKLLGVAKGAIRTAASSEDSDEQLEPTCTPSVAVYPIVFDPVTKLISVDKARPILELTEGPTQ